jgi:hypothetical protein
MGKTMMGSTGSTNLLTPEQQQFLSDALGGTGTVGEAFGQFLQPQNYEQMFQESIVEPTTRAYEQRVVPGIQQRFVDANAASSSALNQALSQGASDLSSQLGGQYMNFLQGQQQNTLGALGQLGGLAGRQTFQPYQQGGLLGSLLGGLGQLGGAYLGRR